MDKRKPMKKKVVVDEDSITVTEYLTPSEIMERFSDLLTEKEKKELKNFYR